MSKLGCYITWRGAGGVVVGDSGRGAEPHIRWLVTQILSNFAVAAPGEWIPAVSVGKTAAPKKGPFSLQRRGPRASFLWRTQTL